MWKFFREENGAILPNDNEGTELMSDALVWVKRQNPDSPGMTVLAWTGTAKGLFGRSRGESIVRSWRFTKPEAVALAVFAAQQLSPAYERFDPNDDRVVRAIAAVSDGSGSALETASNLASLAAGDARAAGDEAAAFAAESARAAVLAAWGADAGKALHAAAYSVLYSVQGAYKIGVGDEVTFKINKWLDMWKSRAASSLSGIVGRARQVLRLRSACLSVCPRVAVMIPDRPPDRVRDGHGGWCGAICQR